MYKKISIIQLGQRPATKRSKPVLIISTRRKKRRNPKRVSAKKTRSRRKPSLAKAIRRLTAMRRSKARSRALSLSNYRRIKGRKRRMTVKQTSRGLVRSPLGIGYRAGKQVRINPSRRRKRRNPMNMIKRTMRSFNLQSAVPILAGLAGGVALKPILIQYVIPKLPVAMQNTALKWSGVATMLAGAMFMKRARKKMIKDAGLGMIVAGVYDIIASNFANLPGIPKITAYQAPTAETTSGLGASIGVRPYRDYSVVGAANISSDMSDAEIIGSDDFDDIF